MLVAAAAARQATPKGGEAGFALWVVFSGLAVFVVNPIAAGFLILLLHLLVLLLLTGGARRRQVVGFALLGLASVARRDRVLPGGLRHFARRIAALRRAARGRRIRRSADAGRRLRC